MQTLDIISINVWQVLISLLNLLILFLVFKKFLFAPVSRIFAARKADVDKAYADAEEARKSAEEARSSYEAHLAGAAEESGAILRDARERAERLGEEIVLEARGDAAVIRERAEADIALEKKKARTEMRDEIAALSVELAGKILEREISEESQRELIDGFLADLEDNDE